MVLGYVSELRWIARESAFAFSRNSMKGGHIKMANLLYTVLVGVLISIIYELIMKATYHIIAKIKAKKKNDEPTKTHRS